MIHLVQNLILIPSLKAILIKKNGKRIDLGEVSTKLVTTVGVNFLVDAFQGLATISNMKFHASGTGTVNESVADTTLGTEVETRTSGSQTESAANIYRTIGTIAYTAIRAITEHGIFSASSGGTLWDRSKFAAINVESGDSIQFTYDLTVNAGG